MFRGNALHASIHKGHISVTDFLLSVGADVNATTNNKSTPLIMASLNGQIDVVKSLMARKANLEAQHSNGCVGYIIIPVYKINFKLFVGYYCF